MIEARHTIRIARPSRDLVAAERFYVEGLGLSVLSKTAGGSQEDHDLLIVGPPDGRWHLELTTARQAAVKPSPTPEDLFVIYLEVTVSEETVTQAVAHGGSVVPPHNSYWAVGGVTITDPDGYRVVLTERRWGPNTLLCAEAGLNQPLMTG